MNFTAAIYLACKNSEPSWRKALWGGPGFNVARIKNTWRNDSVHMLSNFLLRQGVKNKVHCLMCSFNIYSMSVLFLGSSRCWRYSDEQSKLKCLPLRRLLYWGLRD